MKGYKICPAYAGMIPIVETKSHVYSYLSRVCGDDPAAISASLEPPKFVPRMRG